MLFSTLNRNAVSPILDYVIESKIQSKIREFSSLKEHFVEAAKTCESLLVFLSKPSMCCGLWFTFTYISLFRTCMTMFEIKMYIRK